MKLLTALFVFSSLAFGSGKLSVQPAYYLKADKMAMQFGIGVYEPLFGGINYNQWTGYGWHPRVGEDAVGWFTTKHDLEVWDGNLGVAIGYTFQHASRPVDLIYSNDHNVHFKLSYKLW